MLIRAAQPLENVSLRTDGPGRLCQALNITKDKYDGRPLTSLDIHILEGTGGPIKVSVSKRIGVTKARNRMLRFLVKQIPRA